MNPPPTPSPRLLRLVALALLAAFLFQALSPLRINDDAVLLLRMAAAATDGRGVNPPDVASHLPIGYPLLVSAFEVCGLLRPASIVLINIAFALVGLLAAFSIIRRSSLCSVAAAPVAVLLAAFSWVLVKHAALPVTDVVFFGWSMGALWAMTRATASSGQPVLTPSSRWSWLGLALGLSLAATLTRTNGLALFPALLWSAIGSAPGAMGLWRGLRSRPWALVTALACASICSIAGAIALSKTTYFAAFLKQHGASSIWEAAAQAARWRALEAGQVALNVPAAPVSSALAPIARRIGVDGDGLEAVSAAVVMVPGAIFILLAALGIWSARARLAPAHVYVLAYAVLLAAWPFQDPRFELPITPLLFALAGTALAPVLALRFTRWALWAFAAVFVGLSVFAFVLSTRLTLAGDNFPSVYGSGRYANTYRAAFGQPINTASEYGVMIDALEVLKRYEPRARRAWQLDTPAVPAPQIP